MARQTRTPLEEARAGLGDLTHERDELQRKLTKLETASQRVDLSAGASAAVAVLASTTAEREATRAVVGALERQIASQAAKVRALEEDERVKAREAAKAELEALVVELLGAVQALIPRFEAADAAMNRASVNTHPFCVLGAQAHQAIAELEQTDWGRSLLSLPPLPTDRERAIVEARATTLRAKQRLAQLAEMEGDGERIGSMEQGAQASLEQARALLERLGDSEPEPELTPVAAVGRTLAQMPESFRRQAEAIAAELGLTPRG